MKLFKVNSNNRTYWVLHSVEGIYQREITTYLINCVDDLALNHSTVRARAYALKNWSMFVCDCGKGLFNATDVHIKEYRDYLFDHRRPNDSGDAQSRKRTVNQYLRMIYDFYRWLQLCDSSQYLLGPSNAYNIYSELTVKSRIVTEYEKYPLLFRRTSSKSKHRTTYTPDYNIFLSLYRHFIANHSPDVAQRNCLILKIAFEGGFRVGSIASLTIEDFDAQSVRSAVESFTVKPAIQKFGRSNSFDISVNLAMDVIDYINGPRNDILQRCDVQSNHIFLDAIKGASLLSTTISSIFSKASKQLGLPYRSGIHSWRGLFTENLIEYEITARQELGFDSSIESIGMVVSKALGHSNASSQQSYIRNLKLKSRASQAFKHQQEVASLRAQLVISINETEKLRKIVNKRSFD